MQLFIYLFILFLCRIITFFLLKIIVSIYNKIFIYIITFLTIHILILCKKISFLYFYLFHLKL